MGLNKISRLFAYARILSKRNSIVVRNLADWNKSFADPAEFYLDAFRFFYYNLPKALKKHKYYFNTASRGFGEKAFHTMWYLLYNQYRFKNFLEIGIYRGQTISLIGLISKLQNAEITVHGISPFDHSGDMVSNYIRLDYMEDVYKNFDQFLLKRPSLTKAFSTDETALDVIASQQWDCIYIDGSHDYETAKADWFNCSKHIKVGGIIVMDDSALFTNFEPPFFAFKGHPGPSQVLEEIKGHSNFKEVLRVGHNRVFERMS